MFRTSLHYKETVHMGYQTKQLLVLLLQVAGEMK